MHPPAINPVDESISLPWHHPLALARQYAGQEVQALLYAAAPYKGIQRSLLALNPVETVTENVQALHTAISASPPQRWFGFFGYEAFGNTPALAPSPITFPALWFARFATVFEFDHLAQTLTRYGPEPTPCPAATAEILPEVAKLHSNMTRTEYLGHVAATIGRIHAGEFYQANITRKFFGNFTAIPDPFQLYEKLCTVNPAPYSAFLKIGDKAILSSSPECFLRSDSGGHVESSPIKGTARKTGEPGAAEALVVSSKNNAENLMIVDLIRHDLAQSCVAGSVTVDELCALHEFPTLYHLISTVSGQIKPEVPLLELIGHCFPPGSMTGAPKHRVLKWCAEREGIQRGVYSGALGWLHPDGSADLSVVIRTLLLEGDRFEFQTGGGIVADSNPQEELEETLTKAAALAKALGIAVEQLRELGPKQ